MLLVLGFCGDVNIAGRSGPLLFMPPIPIPVDPRPMLAPVGRKSGLLPPSYRMPLNLYEISSLFVTITSDYAAHYHTSYFDLNSCHCSLSNTITSLLWSLVQSISRILRCIFSNLQLHLHVINLPNFASHLPRLHRRQSAQLRGFGPDRFETTVHLPDLEVRRILVPVYPLDHAQTAFADAVLVQLPLVVVSLNSQTFQLFRQYIQLFYDISLVAFHLLSVSLVFFDFSRVVLDTLLQLVQTL